MRELRQDPTTGDWVVIATDRVLRPQHLLSGRLVDQGSAQCPFCPGNEHTTPPTIEQIDRDGEWSVRAFANKYPALGIEGALERRNGLGTRMRGVGAHEVIVETRRHELRLCDHPQQMGDGLELARRRMADLRNDSRFHCFSWFRNVGPEAGATQSHPHAQLIATPVVPDYLEHMVKRGSDHQWLSNKELMDSVIELERDDGRRILWEGERLIAFCPFAPMAAFEVWFVPLQSAPHFMEADGQQIDELAEAMSTVLRAINCELENPAYNAFIHTSPLRLSRDRGFRWHLRLQPRLVPLAGFELATGARIHSVLPEDAAQVLRGAMEPE
ncbi:MAG: hypothetical protein HN348_10970 [Proteobacteria bacterium]|jgi:UDPglucose--hexose-1-phosphate uridylyltransferase|nr:hypothetical protein [Pseudomonadota bacterium]